MTRLGSLSAIGGLVLLVASGAAAQNAADAAALYVRQHEAEIGLASGDADGLVVIDQATSRVSGVTHVYLQQVLRGVPVYNGIVNVAVDGRGRVLSVGSRAVPGLSGAVRSDARGISAEAAVRAAGAALGYAISPQPQPQRALDGPGEGVVFTSDLSPDEIQARLMYVPVLRGGVYLAWVVELTSPDGDHLWQVAVDAGSGAILRQDDLTDHDQWAADDHLPEGWSVVAPAAPETSTLAEIARLTGTAAVGAPAGAVAGQYRVYGGNVESPSHAGDPFADLRTVVTTSGAAAASPQGWHSTGAESYTITRGNNVRAGLDLVAPNGIDLGSEAEGGASLVFNFAFDPSTQSPDAYRPAAVTNLFYWNNIVHDVSWFYGFDEAAGNFQTVNFSGTAAGNDGVLAEGQDYSGTNNANFSTPADGSAPRMQMYVWGTPLVNELSYGSTTVSMSGAGFGVPFPTTGLTAAVAVVNDGTALPAEGCGPLVNAAEVAGKLAVAYRGTCAFTIKAKNAQDAGAVGLIVINNTGGNPITLGGADATVLIPAGMVSDVDGAALVAALPTTATVRNLGQSVLNRDSDFDNGVIIHEYTHGISNRLTGGRLNTGCLATNYTVDGVPVQSEQMGEGWSDYYALLLTDTNTDARGIGTYLNFEPTTGQGIRPYRYSTSFGTNPATYDYIKTAVAPHGVGFVWASMTWDMTRALVDRYGWSPDIYTGTGGNNVALALVTEGMKIQPCRPGFVDGRDAILTADVAINDGANECLIWDAFARRGLGFSADQGGYWDKTDGTEAFDLPVSCATSSMVIDAVREIQAAGGLKTKHADTLVRLLEKAELQAARRPDNALYQLEVFDTIVNKLTGRRLSADQAQFLLDYSAGFRARILEASPTAVARAEAGAELEADLFGDDLPVEFALDQNTPNPVGAATEIQFALPEAVHVRIVVYDMMGRVVATVADGEFPAGVHRTAFDARSLASGAYVYRIEAGSFSATRQMTVVR